MSFKETLVHIDGEEASPASDRRRAYAFSLTRKLGAHLKGLILALQPAMPPMIMGEVPGALLESQRRASIEAGGMARDAFSRAAEAAGVSHESELVECSEGVAAGVFASHGRLSDLVVVGQAERDDPLAIREVLIEAALFDTGRPTLIVPSMGAEAVRLEHIVIAWDGSREAARAAHDALPLLHFARQIEVVVAGEKVTVARSDEPGADLARHLARHDLNTTARQIDANGRSVSEALLAHAAGSGADLLIMGGYGHSRLREMVMGGATRGILDSMTVPVFMSH